MSVAGCKTEMARFESGGQVNVRSGDRRNERGLGGSVSYSLSMSSTPQTMKPVIISKASRVCYYLDLTILV